MSNDETFLQGILKPKVTVQILGILKRSRITENSFHPHSISLHYISIQ